MRGAETEGSARGGEGTTRRALTKCTACRVESRNGDAALFDGLSARLGQHLSEARIRELLPVVRLYPFALPKHWAGRITSEGDPLWRQCVPDPRELAGPEEEESADPLQEARFSPLPGLIRRYPDRALLVLTTACAGYCRFCTRRRLVGQPGDSALKERLVGRPYKGDEVTRVGATDSVARRRQTASLEEVLPWLRARHAIRDVLLSGGDPLTLSPAELERWLAALKALPQLALIRIGTRLPSFAPERIDDALCAVLARFAPLYINTHFNHPQEITPPAREACARLRRAGMILANQSVLLRAVNDDINVLQELCYALLSMGVRPYYLHIMDHVAGTAHFRVSLARAAELWESLAASVSGMGVPRLMIDLPGGGGKIQYMRTRVLETRKATEETAARKRKIYIFRNIENGESVYLDSDED